MPSPRMLALASLNFFTIGIAAATLGPALPDLAHQTGSPLAAVGGVISTIFVGALIAQLIGGPLNDRLGAAPLLRIGLGCTVLGLAGLAASHALWLTLANGVVTGMGYGAVDISTSVLVAVAAGDRNVMALNLINIFYGAGAVAGPALASLSLARWHTALPVIWVGATLALCLLPAVAWLPTLPNSATKDDHPKPVMGLFRVPLLWLFGSLFFLYVGLENGMGGWLSVFVQRTTTASLGTGALVASSFWLALTGGRVLATFWGSRLTPNALLTLALSIIFIGAALMAVGTNNLFVTALATILMGLGCGPVFPTALALTTTRFAGSPGLAASTVIGLGSIGGIILPWVQGLLLTRGHPQISIVFIALLAAAMGGLSVSIALKFGARGSSV
jgi:FHS family glucose/mannose:H+ symporter-like MFS transporter